MIHLIDQKVNVVTHLRSNVFIFLTRANTMLIHVRNFLLRTPTISLSVTTSVNCVLRLVLFFFLLLTQHIV